MQPFPDTTLIPSTGLSKVTFNRVPTGDPDMNEFFMVHQLLSKVKHNLSCTDLQFIMLLHWLCPTQLETGSFSSIFFTFLDSDRSIMHTMLKSYLAMFRMHLPFLATTTNSVLQKCQTERVARISRNCTHLLCKSLTDNTCSSHNLSFLPAVKCQHLTP
jgi:hypothetical protein